MNCFFCFRNLFTLFSQSSSLGAASCRWITPSFGVSLDWCSLNSFKHTWSWSLILPCACKNYSFKILWEPLGLISLFLPLWEMDDEKLSTILPLHCPYWSWVYCILWTRSVYFWGDAQPTLRMDAGYAKLTSCVCEYVVKSKYIFALSRMLLPSTTLKQWVTLLL